MTRVIGALRHKLFVAVAIALCVAATAAAQRGGRGFGGGRFARREPNAPYDGAFRFCRIMFRQNPSGDGDGWSVDYPRADINLSYRLGADRDQSEPGRGWRLQPCGLSAHGSGVGYKRPFIMMTEPGGSYFDEDEAAALRDYLLKGAFWADDF